jgi:predicted GIY-YIG superfamily endonuclease
MEYDARNPPPLVLGNRRGPWHPSHVAVGDEWINYILLLEGGRFYVGATVNIVSRWFLHLDGWHVEWTRIHKPLAVVRTMIAPDQSTAAIHEGSTTVYLMREYGVENVRGGDFCGVDPIDELPHFSRRGLMSNIER